MVYDRNVVIDKINDLKRKSGKWGSGERITNKTIATHLGVTDRAVSDWLQKRPDYISENDAGYPDIPLKHLVELSNLFKCDINYLLDKDMICKTKEATDICKATKLSEEAVSILTKDAGYTTKPRAEVIDFLIKDSDNYASLMFNVIVCKGFEQIIDEYKNNKWFSEFEPIIKRNVATLKDRKAVLEPSGMTNEIMLSMRCEIEDYLYEEKGYSNEEIEQIQEDTDDFFEEYRSRIAEEELIKGMLYNQASRYIEKYLF